MRFSAGSLTRPTKSAIAPNRATDYLRFPLKGTRSVQSLRITTLSTIDRYAIRRYFAAKCERNHLNSRSKMRIRPYFHRSRLNF